jgi:hypothetical protein
VELDVFKALPFRGDDGILRVCYSGGFAAWQGIDNLVQACRLLQQRGWPDRLRLRMIGFTPGSAHVREELAAILKDKFEPVDRVSREEMRSLFADVDIMVIPRTPHPAVRVAMPTKFAEYIASRRPVIVSDVDETAQLVQENGCGLVAEPTADGLANALARAAEMPYDALAEMGLKARDLAERKFGWDKIAEDYYRFLLKVLGKRSENLDEHRQAATEQEPAK